MPSKNKYTDPKLRDQVKQDIQDGDKGGAPGQWSARKAQMMASEYKKRGGDYNTDKSEKEESQKNLDKWGKEDWQTKEGSGKAKKQDGTEKRYLPKKAWEKMNDEEKEETDQKKQEGSKQGKQFVGNTDKAKESRKKATQNGKSNSKKQESEGDDKEGEDEDEDEDEDEKAYVESDVNEDEDEDEVEEESNVKAPSDKEDAEDDDQEEQEEEEEKASAGQKRNKQSNSSSKKQKSNSGEAKKQDNSAKEKNGSSKGKQNGTVGSKHQSAEEPAPKGSKDRLPKKGQQVQWKALPGYVDGKVVEVITKDKQVDGKSVKASKNDPKIVLKSDSSGKICVHKPEACFFD